jgi:SM-20-related protein
MTHEMIAERLERTGLCICPDFISQQSLRETRADFDAIQKSGAFCRAGVGQGDKQVHDLVRRDETHWLDRAAGNAVQSALFKKLDSLKVAFNHTLYLGLDVLEGHYAAYPDGGFYGRHLDCFHQDDTRVVSLVLYLNQDWKPGDGGQLRIYNKDESHVDVVPVGGTMVCFMSRESEHEVLSCHGPRFSFAGWFKRSVPGEFILRTS